MVGMKGFVRFIELVLAFMILVFIVYPSLSVVRAKTSWDTSYMIYTLTDLSSSLEERGEVAQMISNPKEFFEERVYNYTPPNLYIGVYSFNSPKRYIRVACINCTSYEYYWLKTLVEGNYTFNGRLIEIDTTYGFEMLNSSTIDYALKYYDVIVFINRTDFTDSIYSQYISRGGKIVAITDVSAADIPKMRDVFRIKSTASACPSYFTFNTYKTFERNFFITGFQLNCNDPTINPGKNCCYWRIWGGVKTVCVDPGSLQVDVEGAASGLDEGDVFQLKFNANNKNYTFVVEEVKEEFVKFVPLNFSLPFSSFHDAGEANVIADSGARNVLGSASSCSLVVLTNSTAWISWGGHTDELRALVAAAILTLATGEDLRTFTGGERSSVYVAGVVGKYIPEIVLAQVYFGFKY
jgi:hypothetical protein